MYHFISVFHTLAYCPENIIPETEYHPINKADQKQSGLLQYNLCHFTGITSS